MASARVMAAAIAEAEAEIAALLSSATQTQEVAKELKIELDTYKRTQPKSLISEDRGALHPLSMLHPLACYTPL
eukprot:scaffold121564_cov24-Phaeocystis_antarctica.AAC.1